MLDSGLSSFAILSAVNRGLDYRPLHRVTRAETIWLAVADRWLEAPANSV